MSDLFVVIAALWKMAPLWAPVVVMTACFAVWEVRHG